MSHDSRRHTIRVPLRKICSALPAAALLSAGIVFSASAAPIEGMGSGAVASDPPAIVVPDVALTWPPATAAAADDSRLVGPPAPKETPADRKLAQMLPAGTIPGSSSLVTLDSTGIPVRALEGYREAAALTDSADPACQIDWALLAAIGRVESNHARFGGNQLDSSGVARPGIIGIPLDGSNGTARIADSDGGLLDRDTVFDRAVGPMQFIPGTWRASGVDADGDGVKNPQDIADASTGSAVYLCSGPGDLTRPDALRSAILRYNASDSYVQMVTNIASAYRQGVRALPASDLTPVKVVRPTPPAAIARAVRPAPGTIIAAPTAAATPEAAPTAAIPATAAPTTSVPTTSVPTTSVPTTSVPTTSVPTTTYPSTVPTSTTTTSTTPTSGPTTPVTCTPAPTTTGTATAAPGTTSPATPAPCVPEPCAPGPGPTATTTATSTATSTATTTPTATATACPAPAASTSTKAPGSAP
jgi:membrane-bound lytic murein transglycosylase B